jgi:hypothetical protein
VTRRLLEPGGVVALSGASERLLDDRRLRGAGTAAAGEIRATT